MENLLKLGSTVMAGTLGILGFLYLMAKVTNNPDSGIILLLIGLTVVTSSVAVVIRAAAWLT